MLTLESPFFEIKDIVVFRDHASLTTFYYLAGPPRLSLDADGNPEFTLLKYREALDASGNAASRMREQLGGAFLMFGVDCRLSDDTKSSITSELASHVPPDSGEITLVPVLYTHGTVKVVALDYQANTGGAPPAGGSSPGGPLPGAPGGVPSGGTAGTPSRFVRGVVGT